jgi:orotate phosphoribosyltransferase
VGRIERIDDLLHELVGAREGHFLLESGHHGSLWLELDGLFLHPERIMPLADALAERLVPFAGDVVCGPLVGGALLAQHVAIRLRTMCVYSERTSHTPGTLLSATYEVPMVQRPALWGARVVIVDDVVNAGSATRSTIAAVRAAGGHPVALAAVLRLATGPVELAAQENIELISLSAWPGTLWEPATCPRCAAGIPLQDPTT